MFRGKQKCVQKNNNDKNNNNNKGNNIIALLAKMFRLNFVYLLSCLSAALKIHSL